METLKYIWNDTKIIIKDSFHLYFKIMKKITTYPLIFIACIIVLFEEFIWDKITIIIEKLSTFKIFQIFENWIAKQNKYVALCMFVVPCCISIPMKFIGFFLLAHGDVTAGITIIATAEIVGTAIMAKIFFVTKPILMTFPIFAWCYNKVILIKDKARQFVVNSQVWKQISRIKQLGKKNWLQFKYFASKRFVKSKMFGGNHD